MSLTFSSYIFIPYLFFLLFQSKEFIFYNLIVFSAWTSVAIINLSGSSILVAHGIILILFLKVIYALYTKRMKFNIKPKLSLFLFVIICGISIFQTFYKHQYVVLTPNDSYDYVRFSFQNITQYLYLILGYITYIITYLLLKNKIINFKKVMDSFILAFTLIIILGYIQLVLPVESYNIIFRNTVYINNQTFLGMTRVSSLNAEASMMSLFLVPMTALSFIRFNQTVKIKYLMITIFGFFLGILSNSSAFYIGIICFISIFILYKLIYLKRHIKFKKFIINYFTFCFGIVFIILILDYLKLGITGIIEKINGEGASGAGRSIAFKQHINVFLKNPILGVGFGSARSYDLFSGWLVQVGIFGIIFYIYYILNSSIRLLIQKNSLSLSFGMVIIVINVILFASVPEYGFLYIWIIYGIGEYLISLKTGFS